MIRVLRLLEYVYETNERAEEDMGRWGAPASGTAYFGNIKIRSAIITDLNHEIDDRTD